MSGDVIAIIPARGGSKGIPRKNLKSLKNKPLIYYSIESAQKSSLINRIIVSTDDDEITSVSRKFGCEVIKRPDSIATDESPTIDAVLHIINTLGISTNNDVIIVLLQPTSPLRNYADIDKALGLFLENDCDSIVSVCLEDHSPYWTFRISNNLLVPVFSYDNLLLRRQDLPEIYRPNGAIFISYSNVLSETRTFYNPKMKPYIMPIERSVDIDNNIDFQIAEQYLNE